MNRKTYPSIKDVGAEFIFAGALLASAIPMLIGLIFLMPLLKFIPGSCEPLFGNARCGNIGPDYWLMAFPTGLTFFLATPLVAMFSVRTVFARETLNEKKDILKHAMLAAFQKASIAHCAAALIYPPILNGLVPSNDTDALLFMFAISIPIHFFLWIFITVPLSLFCAWIFYFVTSRVIMSVQEF